MAVEDFCLLIVKIFFWREGRCLLSYLSFWKMGLHSELTHRQSVINKINNNSFNQNNIFSSQKIKQYFLNFLQRHLFLHLQLVYNFVTTLPFPFPRFNFKTELLGQDVILYWQQDTLKGSNIYARSRVCVSQGNYSQLKKNRAL